MSMLKVENLVAGYDVKKPVLKNLSFTVYDGDFVGIVGPNGSGKTTLLRSLIGLLSPFSGTIMVDNHKVEGLDKKELARKISFVPQLMEPVEGFTVEDLIMLGRIPYLDRFKFESPDDLEAVKWAIEELGIEKLKDRPITELSGGEFQRAAIARALAQEPRILLLDEPTSHLDIRFQVKISKLLKKLRKHRSIVATFHDLNLAAKFCSKLLIMKNGEIVDYGAPEDVVTPQNIWKTYRIKVAVQKNEYKKRARYVLLP